MRMILKIAFRNIFRNGRRTILSAMSVFFAAMITGLAQGWINGALGLFVDNFVNYQTGHIRIRSQEFEKRKRFMPVDSPVANSSALAQKIRNIDKVETVEERIYFTMLLGTESIQRSHTRLEIDENKATVESKNISKDNFGLSGEKKLKSEQRKNEGATIKKQESTIPVLAIGVNLGKSRFDLNHHLKEGSLTQNGIVAGKRLAEKTGARKGQEILLVSRTAEGGLNGIKLPIQGITETGIPMFDERVLFLPLAEAKKLLKLHGDSTELYVYLKDESDLDEVLKQIAPLLSGDLILQSYKESLGSFYGTLQMAKIAYLFIESMILFLASFVIINIMMMAIFERMHEIGTLKALGMKDRQLVSQFAIEGGIVGLLGGIPGALVGFGIISYLSHIGVNLGNMVESFDAPISYIIYPQLKLIYLVYALILSVAIPALTALIPALYTRKLKPAEALRKIS